jgi:hypothetical protein
MGMVRCAIQRNKPLSAMAITAIIIPVNFDDMVWDSLNPSGHPISKIPAMIKKLSKIRISNH